MTWRWFCAHRSLCVRSAVPRHGSAATPRHTRPHAPRSAVISGHSCPPTIFTPVLSCRMKDWPVWSRPSAPLLGANQRVHRSVWSRHDRPRRSRLPERPSRADPLPHYPSGLCTFRVHPASLHQRLRFPSSWGCRPLLSGQHGPDRHLPPPRRAQTVYRAGSLMAFGCKGQVRLQLGRRGPPFSWTTRRHLDPSLTQTLSALVWAHAGLLLTQRA